jgi:hypothetical protein
MSTQITVELDALRAGAKLFARKCDNFERELQNLTKRFRDARNNERRLTSRNKREGWYMSRQHSQVIDPKTLRFKYPGRKVFRTPLKEWALRYRKQTGAQVIFVKERK